MSARTRIQAFKASRFESFFDDLFAGAKTTDDTIF
ncbi:hypothetical protein LPPLD21_01954 [Lactiplantibacillus paraplantarum]|uniref:Uncharacterized protein n=1 Tax=Lactiplantibacillus paraplantarum TaxID=60520 RepID=A0ABQ0NBN5_9LACO|nr:hypothetical protein LPPLD21_01954 [Lactiplantibacillus paraplantarum]